MKSKNCAIIVEDSTAFCPNIFNECEARGLDPLNLQLTIVVILFAFILGIHIANGLCFIIISRIALNI